MKQAKVLNDTEMKRLRTDLLKIAVRYAQAVPDWISVNPQEPALPW